MLLELGLFSCGIVALYYKHKPGHVCVTWTRSFFICGFVGTLDTSFSPSGDEILSAQEQQGSTLRREKCTDCIWVLSRVFWGWGWGWGVTDMWKTFSFTPWTPFIFFCQNWYFRNYLVLTHSLPQPIHHPDWKVHTKACKWKMIHVYWAVQAGLLTPLIFARHHLSPLATFTPYYKPPFNTVHLMQIGLPHAETSSTKSQRISDFTLFLLPSMWCSCLHSNEGVNLFFVEILVILPEHGVCSKPAVATTMCSVPLLTC